jgi:hypothetical protein
VTFEDFKKASKTSASVARIIGYSVSRQLHRRAEAVHGATETDGG